MFAPFNATVARIQSSSCLQVQVVALMLLMARPEKVQVADSSQAIVLSRLICTMSTNMMRTWCSRNSHTEFISHRDKARKVMRLQTMKTTTEQAKPVQRKEKVKVSWEWTSMMWTINYAARTSKVSATLAKTNLSKCSSETRRSIEPISYQIIIRNRRRRNSSIDDSKLSAINTKECWLR